LGILCIPACFHIFTTFSKKVFNHEFLKRKAFYCCGDRCNDTLIGINHEFKKGKLFITVVMVALT
jgi:hypothetical protein